MTRLTSQDIAERLGISDRAVRKRLASTPKHKRIKGSGYEYEISDLPDEWQDRLQEQAQPETIAPQTEPKVAEIRKPPRLEQRRSHQLEEGETISIPFPHRKLATIQEILFHFDRYVLEHPGVARTSLHYEFTRAYAKKQILPDSFTRELYPTFHSSTLGRWDKERHDLLRKKGKPGRKTKIPAEYQEEAIALVAQGWKATHIHEWLLGEGINIHVCNVQRFIANWKSKNQYTAAIFADPDKARGKFTSAIGSQEATRVNQTWELDSTLSDVVLADGKRYAIIGGIDVFSRRCRFFVSRTSSADAIMSLMRRMLTDFGKPESVKTDRGRDYLSNYLSGVLKGLGIHHKACKPRNPVEKPHIERLFHTLCDDLLAREDGFLGRNVAERKALQSRNRALSDRTEEITSNLTPQEFQAELDKWCEHYEKARVHSSLETTPMQKWIEGMQSQKIITFTQSQLDLFLAPAPKAAGNDWGDRKANKGCIEINGLTYVAPELMLDENGEEWAGRLVHCRYDALDPSRIVVYEDSTLTKFICIAECKQLASVASLKQAAKQAKRAERQIKAAAKEKMAEQTTALEEVKQARESAAEKVVAFIPRATQEEFQSESLQQAEQSLEENRVIAKATGASKVKADDRPEVRDNRYFCWAYEWLKAGKSLESDDLRWMRHFMNIPEGIITLEHLEVEPEEVLALFPVEQPQIAVL